MSTRDDVSKNFDWLLLALLSVGAGFDSWGMGKIADELLQIRWPDVLASTRALTQMGVDLTVAIILSMFIASVSRETRAARGARSETARPVDDDRDTGSDDPASWLDAVSWSENHSRDGR